METTDDSKDTKMSLSKEDIAFKYLPIAGAVSYEIFSLNIMNPREFSNVVGDKDIALANSIWFNAHIGLGLYMYNQKHLQALSNRDRIMYSVFGTCIFNFGSVLLWATAKHVVPDVPVFRTLLGLASGAGLLYVGKRYLEHLNSL
ncbi:uncharacterized protein [Mytilus edulis]|uniref:uncharacterized protein LOC134725586 n=1 Tax=Mytilus trossulus TaxID=6551 RepID=UPI00300532D5